MKVHLDFFRFCCWNNFWQKYCRHHWRAKRVFWIKSRRIWEHHSQRRLSTIQPVWTVWTIWTVWTTSERKIVGIRAGLLQLGLRLPRSQEKKMAKIGLMLAKQCEIRVCLIHNIHSDSDSKDALRVHTYQSIYNCVPYVFCHLLTHFHFIKHPCVV